MDLLLPVAAQLNLLQDDEAAAIRLLQERGIILGDFDTTQQKLEIVEKIKYLGEK